MSTPPNKLQQIAATNQSVAGNPAPKSGHNETANVKGLILAIVQSLEMMDEERDTQKELLAKLKADHDIEPKVARKVAKILHKKNKKEVEEEATDVDNLYKRIS